MICPMPGMRPEDVYALTTLKDPRLSPDGKTIAFVFVGADRENNRYASGIWTAPADGSWEPRPFTSGEHREDLPRFSPDGTLLAFVSHREKKKCELNLIPISGGEGRQIASFDEEVEQIAWSPDGLRLAFLVRVRDEKRYGKEEEKDQPPRRIDRLVYRLDNVGWTIDRPTQLFVIDLDGGEPRQLTTGNYPLGGITWSPDGKQLAFVSARHKTWDLDLAQDIFTIGASGGRPTKLTKTGAVYSSPSWSPDGSRIAFLFRERAMDAPLHGRLGAIDVASRKTTVLTEHMDRNALPYPPMREPAWVSDDLYFAAEDSGNVHLYRVPATGEGKPELILGGDRQISGFDIAGSTLAFIATTPTRLMELYTASPEESRIVDGGTAFQKKVKLVSPRRFTATSKDGSEVEAWVMPPAGFVKGRKYPALLNIHGGPFTQYGNRFFDEFQIYAGAGYAVVYANPRGSSGYSEGWGRAIRGPQAQPDPGSGWGGVDFEDLMAVVDEAVRRFDFIDGKRFGVLGGSYGGYMTSWIVGHTDRFRAACSERACNNLLTMSWASDIGHFFKGYLGPSHLEDPEEYLRQSPITHADDIKTPLLILHSEKDLRCPIEQAEQLFVALRMRGQPVEFVRFPGSSHELSRSGPPYQRVERFKIILEFFDRHLKSKR